MSVRDLTLRCNFTINLELAGPLYLPRGFDRSLQNQEGAVGPRSRPGAPKAFLSLSRENGSKARLEHDTEGGAFAIRTIPDNAPCCANFRPRRAPREKLLRQFLLSSNREGSLGVRSGSRQTASDADGVGAARNHPVSLLVHIAQIAWLQGKGDMLGGAG